MPSDLLTGKKAGVSMIAMKTWTPCLVKGYILAMKQSWKIKSTNFNTVLAVCGKIQIFYNQSAYYVKISPQHDSFNKGLLGKTRFD